MSPDTRAMLTPILAVYRTQGAKQVYVAECCERTLVSTVVPVSCGTCGKTPEFEQVATGDAP